jgi:hypothetical protein
VTSGLGLVQTRDGHTIAMLPGDTVYTPPGIWHWRGAMPGSFMTHLALADSSAEPGALDVEWGRARQRRRVRHRQDARDGGKDHVMTSKAVGPSPAPAVR